MHTLKSLTLVCAMTVLAACAGGAAPAETHRCVEIPNGLVACEVLGEG